MKVEDTTGNLNTEFDVAGGNADLGGPPVVIPNPFNLTLKTPCAGNTNHTFKIRFQTNNNANATDDAWGLTAPFHYMKDPANGTDVFTLMCRTGTRPTPSAPCWNDATDDILVNQ